ncbi:MAG TPA: hypothetical protein VJ548_00470 [Azospira sp.]|nr:hypothetical protein [Azospira sp.]
MKSNLRFGLILAFVIGVAVTIIQFNTHRPRLLVLHSAGAETERIRAINRGLRDELRNKNYFSIRWYYSGLSDKGDQGLAEAEGLRARRLVDGWAPKVILAVGDEAQQYVTRHYANRPDIKIVYCAVHDDVEPYGLDHAANATGAVMIPPLEALEEMLAGLGQQLGLKRPLRVVHLGDLSDDVGDDGEFMAARHWSAVRFLGNHYVRTFDAWQATVRQAAKQTDFILTSDYRELARSATDPSRVPAEEVVAWTVEHSPVPVIGTRAQYVWDGGMLAMGASQYEQGREAGSMAVRLLEQVVSPAVLPARSPKEFVVAARESRLMAQNLNLPPVYQALARASNNYFQ